MFLVPPRFKQALDARDCATLASELRAVANRSETDAHLDPVVSACCLALRAIFGSLDAAGAAGLGEAAVVVLRTRAAREDATTQEACIALVLRAVDFGETRSAVARRLIAAGAMPALVDAMRARADQLTLQTEGLLALLQLVTADDAAAVAAAHAGAFDVVLAALRTHGADDTVAFAASNLFSCVGLRSAERLLAAGSQWACGACGVPVCAAFELSVGWRWLGHLHCRRSGRRSVQCMSLRRRSDASWHALRSGAPATAVVRTACRETQMALRCKHRDVADRA